MNTTHAPLLPDSPAIPPRSGLAYTSVPKILLGLGALCLLVAAGIFLAVSWSSLGVGGRTAVLAALTLAALGSTVGLHRSGLRMAAEAISVVTLGLLTLDVYGAAAAGLLPALHPAGVTLLAGALLALAGGAFGLATRTTQPRLVAPQVVSGIGIVLAYVGGANVAGGHPLVVGHAAVLGAGLLAWLARRAGLPVQQWSCLAAAVPAWLGATATACFDGLSSPTVHQLWIAGSGWSLLVSAVGLLVPAAVLRNRVALLVGGSGSALLVTVAATLPVIGSSATTVIAVAIGVTAAWTLALALVRSNLRVVAIAPTALGSLITGGAVLVITGYDLNRWALLQPAFRHGLLVHLHGPVPPLLAGLVVPAALVLGAVLAVAIAGSGRVSLLALAGLCLPAGGIGAAVALAAYDVPLALSCGALALTGAAIAAVCARDDRPGSAAYAVLSLTLLAGAIVGATPSAGLTVAAAAVGVLVAAGLALTAASRAVRVIAETAVVAAATSLVVAVIELAAHDAAWIAVPALLVAGLIALARPVAWVEVPAAAFSVVLLPVSLSVAHDPLALMALWLVVAGGLCCAAALLHPARRPLALVGAAAWTLAVWVRLADQHVSVTEAYTLPFAAALLVAGVFQLRRNRAVGTQVLLPGLLLAIVPTLLLVLGDPLSLRALLLGAGSVALVLAGAAMRWSTPLVTGAVAGVVLVLRELGPYAASVPQWIWIGSAGVLLTVAGITWERQLRDLRRAVALIGRLR